MKARVACVFGQFGAAADPVSLPVFRDRLNERGVETILIQHYDSKSAYDFLHRFNGFCATVGSSLGAMSAVVFAGYLMPQTIDFVGGFQPSDYDPSGHSVAIQDPSGDLITRAITVPKNVRHAMCFRNPIGAATGFLGHATYIAADPTVTDLKVINRADVHAGDFPPAADIMFDRLMELIG